MNCLFQACYSNYSSCFKWVNVANLQERMKALPQKYLNLLSKRFQTYFSRWKHELSFKKIVKFILLRLNIKIISGIFVILIFRIRGEARLRSGLAPALISFELAHTMQLEMWPLIALFQILFSKFTWSFVWYTVSQVRITQTCETSGIGRNSQRRGGRDLAGFSAGQFLQFFTENNAFYACFGQNSYF